jgi:signal transduction histidine kinase
MLFSLIGTCIAALISFSLMVLMKRTFSYYFLGSVFVCLILFSWYFHDILIRWNESLTLFSQARWAASEYAKVNNRLQDSMTTTEMDIRDQERMRIAREIHDILGYGITGSLVQITMAKELVKIDVDAAITTLGKIEDCLRIALKDVRGEVNKLKCQTVAFGNWREQWDSLCNNFAWSTGVQVHTNISTELIGVDEKIGENVYRIIQEALTNAYRHGSSSLIDVSMKYKKELRQILLRISDNGYGCDKIRMGNGLSGIKERVKELSGETAWQTESNAGFDIGVSIPWEKRPSVAEN